MTGSRDDTAPAWTDPDDAPDLTAPEWRGRMDAAPVIRPRGRPRSETPKALTSLRLSTDVLDAFKATGPGWQTRIDATLWEAVDRHVATRNADHVERFRKALDKIVKRRKGKAQAGAVVGITPGPAGPTPPGR